MTCEVTIFSAAQMDEYKQYIHLRAGSYVFAGPEDPGAGPLMLHTARCMHVKDNKTARLIAPGEVRVVARTARDLYAWLSGSATKSGQSTGPCQSCKTAELVERYAKR